MFRTFGLSPQTTTSIGHHLVNASASVVEEALAVTDILLRRIIWKWDAHLVYDI
jgi:hypothetical protein